MYCVANKRGELIAHDIEEKYQADVICKAMQEEEPNEEWEVINYEMD